MLEAEHTDQSVWLWSLKVTETSMRQKNLHRQYLDDHAAIVVLWLLLSVNRVIGCE